MHIDTKIDKAIRDIDKVICDNIDLKDSINRGFLSQNILSQLRNFVEHVSLKVYSSGHDIDAIDYENIQAALVFVKTRGELSFLAKFHKLLHISASHYTLDGNGSERLMLKYYEYLLRTKRYLETRYNFTVLDNILDFPIDQDPSLREYRAKISEKIDLQNQDGANSGATDHYYIYRVRPFFVEREVYYEVTFSAANDRISKFDRVIAFTLIDIPDNYAARLTLINDSINLLGKNMPIKIIKNWESSIRPCEFNNFAKIFGEQINTLRSIEYKEIMKFLNDTHLNLVDLVNSPPDFYDQLRNHATQNSKQIKIFSALDKARSILMNKSPGHNIVRYLLLRMKNRVIKQQYKHDGCDKLSNLNLKYGCMPFDEMPYNTSPVGHNPKIADLLECIPSKGREHELFARLIKNNVEHRGILYTPIEDIKGFDNVDDLIKRYNSKLYYKHKHRELNRYLDNIFIKSYEENTHNIVTKLLELSANGLNGYTESVESWLKETSYNIDDPEKEKALKELFKQSKAVLIYGAAGTGKSTMINHVSHLLSDKNKLYLANTNPAIDNLRRKVTTANSQFKTIAKHTLSADDTDYDILFIDECSTVSNSDMIGILDETSFKLVVLVGDIYQIESILFGNWFSAIRFFIPKSSVFELTTPFRTSEAGLLNLWKKVRKIDDDILEFITKNNYSQRLDKSVFNQTTEDEIILCLNYDGLYGINNTNKFLQSSNNNPAVEWGVATYKIDDPVLFNESERFKPLIYNNLKGRIVDIVLEVDKIQFDIEIDKAITQLDVESLELEWIKNIGEKSVIRFVVHRNKSTDDDNDSVNTIVPFQVAYAVSIHKAQGLEYNSVKIVITDEIDEAITHSIFYTAITRARENLKIYWTPEVEKKILDNLERKINRRDVNLLSKKYSLSPDLFVKI